MYQIIIVLIVIFLIAYSNYRNKKNRKKTLLSIEQNWGEPKKNESYNFASIQKYFINNLDENAFHIISDRTKNDIDLDELFKYIDRTSSKVGQQYLYYKIRVIQDKDKNILFNKLVHLFEEDGNLRIKCQIILSRLNSYDSYDLEELINKPFVKPGYVKYLIPLAITSFLAVLLGVLFYHEFFLLVIPVFAINLVLHFKNKDNINYLISAVNQLKIALKVSKLLLDSEKLSSLFPDTLFVDEVSKLSFKTKFIAFQKHLENDIMTIFWYIVELLKVFFNIEAIIFYSFIDSIIKKNSSINELFRFIGLIDIAISTVSVKSSATTCKPEFTKDKLMELEEIIHPIIENCISNSIKLDKNSLLLTGSNMSGKTTFVRTVAINTILAQTLNFAFAKKFKIPFFKLYSSIRVSDNLLSNTSYYLQEVLVIKELIEVSDSKIPCLFILDEIFKGTNTVERISGGKAILSYLNNKTHFVLVSTHDIELTELLKDNNFDHYHFTESIENENLHFDHKLKKGILKNHNAIKILELYNYPKSIIIDAKKTKNIVNDKQ
jgi:ABC-type molybdenum transport system ATPase subunit/photorepair protein PhrA